RVTERHHCPVNSDEHAAQHGCEEWDGTAAGKEWNGKAGSVSESGLGRENQGHGASAAEWREHRTGGRSGPRWSGASTLPRYCVSRSLCSPLSCDEILTGGRNRMG